MRATLGSCSTGWSSTSSTVTRDWCWDARPPVRAIACVPMMQRSAGQRPCVCKLVDETIDASPAGERTLSHSC